MKKLLLVIAIILIAISCSVFIETHILYEKKKINHSTVQKDTTCTDTIEQE